MKAVFSLDDYGKPNMIKGSPFAVKGLTPTTFAIKDDMLLVACSGPKRNDIIKSLQRPTIEMFHICEDGSLSAVENSTTVIKGSASTLMTDLNFTNDGFLWLSYYSNTPYFGKSIVARLTHQFFYSYLSFVFAFIFPQVRAYKLSLQEKELKSLRRPLLSRRLLGEAFGSSPNRQNNQIYVSRTLVSVIDIYEADGIEVRLLETVQSGAKGACWTWIDAKNRIFMLLI